MLDAPEFENGRFIEGGSSDASRLERAAWAFTTRRVDRGEFRLLTGARVPQAGDLVLARIESIGHHSGLQLAEGRRRTLFVGDQIVVAYGNRYAPNQFEAVVPKTIGPCHLVAAGGVAGKALTWHSTVTKGPTRIIPVGLVADPDGQPVNLRAHALPSFEHLPSAPPPTIAVVGTAMDSGKTQTAAYLVRGLALAGLRVGYAKVTGTGSGGDTWLLRDAGANLVLDFTDAGLVSTYLISPDELRRVFVTLLTHMTRAGMEAVVLEMADGLLQGETAALLESAAFRETVTGIIFAANDAMGAVAGHEWLRGRRLPILAVSGVLTAAPLQRLESSRATGLPALSRQDLARPRTALEILGLAESRRPEPVRRGPAAGQGHRLDPVAERLVADPASEFGTMSPGIQP